MRDWLIGVALFLALMIVAFWLGRVVGQADAVNDEIVKRDTVVRKDTVKVPHVETQLVTQEVVRYKYVPITLDAVPDTVVKRDTIIQVEDGVAIIPISIKTYTDSATYRAVVSGYDPRLEEIEVYRDNMVVTETVRDARRWSLGLQGGMYVTPKGLMPGVGVGVNWRIGK